MLTSIVHIFLIIASILFLIAGVIEIIDNEGDSTEAVAKNAVHAQNAQVWMMASAIMLGFIFMFFKS